jgi:Tfp pilus assembly protein PilX
MHRIFPLPSELTRERGAVLFIALIALVLMSLAGISLVRSVDTANVIAGNVAFKKSSTQLADLGMELAYNKLNSMTEAQRRSDVAGSASDCAYAATLNNPVNLAGQTPVTITGIPSGYQVRCVIERLCTDLSPTVAGITVAQEERECITDQRLPSSQTESSPGIQPPIYFFYYRIRVRVTGPQNTVSETQATFAF